MQFQSKWRGFKIHQREHGAHEGSKRNLYELQVDCGSLGHKGVDDSVFGSKRVTFEVDKCIGLEGEIVKAGALKNENFQCIIVEYMAIFT